MCLLGWCEKNKISIAYDIDNKDEKKKKDFKNWIISSDRAYSWTFRKIDEFQIYLVLKRKITLEIFWHAIA